MSPDHQLLIEAVEKLDIILAILQQPKKPTKHNTLKQSKTWIKLVTMLLDDTEIPHASIPYNVLAEQAIKDLKDLYQLNFTDELCEAIITSYPAVNPDSEDFAPYPWTQPGDIAYPAYETLNNELNNVFDLHSKNLYFVS
jgi:hypothetical protein